MPSLLVAEARLNPKGGAIRSRPRIGHVATTVPIFLHVPPVELPKRPELARDALRVHESFSGLTEAHGGGRPPAIGDAMR